MRSGVVSMTSSVETKRVATRGVMYVVHGERYLKRAELSAASLKRNMPDLPITLFTAKPAAASCFDMVVPFDPEDTQVSFGFVKVSYLCRSPYEQTVFLDADTYVCAPFYELFELMDHFDAAVAHDTFRTYTADAAFLQSTIERIPESFPMLNSGVIVFRRNDPVARLLDQYVLLYERDKSVVKTGGGNYCNDQTAFREALYSCGARVATLPPEYNCRVNHPVFVNSKVKILHGVHSDLSRVEYEINRKLGNRVFLPALGVIHERDQGPFQLTRWYIEEKARTFWRRHVRSKLSRLRNWKP